MSEYKGIIEKIKLYLQRRGIEKECIEKSFVPCTDEHRLAALSKLYDFYSKWSAIFLEEDEELVELKDYELPESVLNFYRDYEPNELPCLEGGIYLLNLEGIKDENSNSSPGAYLIKYGLVTIAITIGGNAICLDLNWIANGEPRVVYADNSWFSFNDEERKVEFSFYPFDIEEEDEFLTHSIIKKYLPQISQSFHGFLEMLSSESEWEAEDYYDLIGK